MCTVTVICCQAVSHQLCTVTVSNNGDSLRPKGLKDEVRWPARDEMRQGREATKIRKQFDSMNDLNRDLKPQVREVSLNGSRESNVRSNVTFIFLAICSISVRIESLINSVHVLNFIHNGLGDVLRNLISCIPSISPIRVWVMYSGNASGSDGSDGLHAFNSICVKLVGWCIVVLNSSRCGLVSETLEEHTVSLVHVLLAD